MWQSTLKIVKCKELESKKGYFSISVYLEPFLINGFLYIKDKDSLQMPRDWRGRRGVSMYGRQVIVLKKLMRKHLLEINN